MSSELEGNLRDFIAASQILRYKLEDDGIFPNNARLPLLVYQGVLSLPERNSAEVIEMTLNDNGWGGSWRNGIYGFHHYHSTAHEVLCCYSGSAEVQLGGEAGVRLAVRKGDVILIPAGIAHKNLGGSSDFSVVGAYPLGTTPDMNYGKPDERPRADHNIDQLHLPKADPILGINGPLFEYWAKR